MYSSKNLFAVAILLACGTITVSARDCPKACTREYNPVCATNGYEFKSFGNPCMMDAFNCEHDFSWTRTKSLYDCPELKEYLELSKRNCYKPCTFEFNPVCGFNGEKYQIFGNQCGMENAHCDDGKVWSVSNLANCVETELYPVAVAETPKKNCNKICTFIYAPVCASNGKTEQTFANECMLEAFNCENDEHFIVNFHGQCGEQNVKGGNFVEDCEKPCTKILLPTCGTDGQHFQVFANPCVMGNQHCFDNKEWKITNFVECQNIAPIAESVKKCNRRCPKIYAPICASNGKTQHTFNNECLLELYNCENNEHFVSTFSGRCEEQIQVDQQSEKKCNRRCPKIYAPICASNGKTEHTFNNECLLELHNCENNEHFVSTFSGRCEEQTPVVQQSEKKCNRRCPKIYRPMCASNGKTEHTFNNECLLELYNCENNEHFVSTFSGRCEEKVPVVKKDCLKICPAIYAPVCASNGKTQQTFPSQCMMESFNCENNEHFAVTFSGECLEKIPAAETPKKECNKICPAIYAPVCASNGKTQQTFSNTCMLEVFNCENNEHFAVTFSGECLEKIPVAETSKKNCNKACTFIYAPVCASNGETQQTFANECVMNTFNCENEEHFAVTFSGKCYELMPVVETPKKDCNKICPAIYAPVCASNGKTQQTFSNTCMLEVFNCEMEEHFAVTFSGVCSEEPQIEPKIMCPAIYDPQCGFDGEHFRVFPNQCSMGPFASHFKLVDLSLCSHLLNQ